MPKRQVEVFTAGCPLCEPAVRLVEELACPDCEVTVYDLHQSGNERAAAYGVKVVPSVAVDGRLLACCQTEGPTREELTAAGVGQPLPEP